MQSLFLLITLAVLLAVLLADVLNALLDPRTRTAGKPWRAQTCLPASAARLPRRPAGQESSRAAGVTPRPGRAWRWAVHGGPLQPQGQRGSDLLLFVVILAAVPGLIAHDPPRAEIDRTVARSVLGAPARHHAYGQDIFAQFIWGARETLIIAFGRRRPSPPRWRCSSAWPPPTSAASTDGCAQPDHRRAAGDPAVPAADRDRRATLHGGRHLRADRVVITVTGWSYGARQLRAQALSLRNRDFLEAARVRGERSSYIIVVEILPTMTSLIVANFLDHALYAVLFAAGLQFIGLGDPNSVELGHDALLGAEQRGAADRPAAVGDRARRCASPCWARRSRCSTTRSTRSATRPCDRSGGVRVKRARLTARPADSARRTQPACLRSAT